MLLLVYIGAYARIVKLFRRTAVQRSGCLGCVSFDFSSWRCRVEQFGSKTDSSASGDLADCQSIPLSRCSPLQRTTGRRGPIPTGENDSNEILTQDLSADVID